MIGVDWGTSSLRAYRIAPDGTILARREAARGILSVDPGGFAAALREEVGAWLAAGERNILLAGMVGSRQGWIEAPYLPCPTGAAEIADALVAVPFAEARARLVPGLSDRDEAGVPEVMRGEETQILGVCAALGGNGLACLPGSHSKWAQVRDGRIAGFRTFLSGETFAALRSATILGRMMPEAPLDIAAFDRGVARSGMAGHLLHHLFGVRSLGLAGELPETQSASYLSGLLIGHEVRAAGNTAAVVHLIGAAALCTLYARAITLLGGSAVVMDADAAAAGLALIGASARWD